MNRMKGDLVALAINGEFDLIIHDCNCFTTMGVGIAKTIKQYFPEAYNADLKTVKGDKSKLGKISWAKVERGNGELIIVNGYTQFNWRGSGRKVAYEAIREVFKVVKKEFSGLNSLSSGGSRLGRWRLGNYFRNNRRRIKR